jgi:hypothetical protein
LRSDYPVHKAILELAPTDRLKGLRTNASQRSW